jgi:putative ABC transport system ATP-binding protein
VITDPSTAADLLDVLGRDAEPDGIVRLDGTDLGTVTLAEVSRAVLVARHDAALFEGTLADNLPTDGSSDEAALAALAASLRPKDRWP